MTANEAEAIRQMIDGHWNLRMNQPTAELWTSVLLQYDPAQATAAVAHLAQKIHYTPKISDLKEVMRLLYPPTPDPSVREIAEFKRGVAAPEWVWVWSWARWHRDPREERSFPQQSGYVDDTESMTMAEYSELLAEWKEAGSPKSASPLPMALR